MFWVCNMFACTYFLIISISLPVVWANCNSASCCLPLTWLFFCIIVSLSGFFPPSLTRIFLSVSVFWDPSLFFFSSFNLRALWTHCCIDREFLIPHSFWLLFSKLNFFLFFASSHKCLATPNHISSVKIFHFGLIVFSSLCNMVSLILTAGCRRLLSCFNSDKVQCCYSTGS